MIRGPIEHLRTVRLQVHPGGQVTVELDGVPLTRPDHAWGRDDFAAILDHASNGRRHPIRIEVHETDGSPYSDILPAARTPTTPTSTSVLGRWPVTASGFLPGEKVAIAVVIDRLRADEHGSLTLPAVPVLPAADTAAGGVVLLGFTSGTIHVEPGR